MQSTELLYFPLTIDDFKMLKKGDYVLKHYHLLPTPSRLGLVYVIAWNKSIAKAPDEKAFKEPLKAGVDIGNIPLDAGQLRKLELSDDGISVVFNGYEVLVLSEKTLCKLKQHLRL